MNKAQKKSINESNDKIRVIGQIAREYKVRGGKFNSYKVAMRFIRIFPQAVAK